LPDLPMDVQEDLCSRFLSARDICNLSLTCRSETALLTDAKLWERLCSRDFGVEKGDLNTYREIKLFDFRALFTDSKPVTKGFEAVTFGHGFRFYRVFGGCHRFFCARPSENALYFTFELRSMPTHDLVLELEHASTIVIHHPGFYAYVDIRLNGSSVAENFAPQSLDFTHDR